MKWLVEKGAEVDSKDNSGQTPMSWAAEYGHVEVVRLLLEKGADIESTAEDGWIWRRSEGTRPWPSSWRRQERTKGRRRGRGTGEAHNDNDDDH